MKWLLIASLWAVLALVSCEANHIDDEAAQEPPATPPTLPDSFYMQFRGKIGDDLMATFDIFREDSTLKGQYYLDIDGKQMELRGDIWPSGRINIQDNSKADKYSKNFVGQFTDEATVSGFVFDLDRHRMDRFQLKRTTKGNLGIQMQYYRERDCERVPLGEDDYYSQEYERASASDTVEKCSGVYIDKFRVSTGDPKADKEIKFALAQSIFSFDSGCTSIADYVQSIHSYAGPSYVVKYHNFELVTNTHGVFAVRHWSSVKLKGDDSHPDAHYLNFDIKTGKRITLDEVIVPGARRELALMVQPLLKKNERIQSYNFLLEDLPGEHFSIQTEGLLFTDFIHRYDSHFGIEETEILLPYPQIIHLLRKPWLAARIQAAQ